MYCSKLGQHTFYENNYTYYSTSFMYPLLLSTGRHGAIVSPRFPNLPLNIVSALLTRNSPPVVSLSSSPAVGLKFYTYHNSIVLPSHEAPTYPILQLQLLFALASTQSAERHHPSRFSYRPSPHCSARHHIPRHTTLATAVLHIAATYSSSKHHRHPPNTLDIAVTGMIRNLILH